MAEHPRQTKPLGDQHLHPAVRRMVLAEICSTTLRPGALSRCCSLRTFQLVSIMSSLGIQEVEPTPIKIGSRCPLIPVSRCPPPLPPNNNVSTYCNWQRFGKKGNHAVFCDTACSTIANLATQLNMGTLHLGH